MDLASPCVFYNPDIQNSVLFRFTIYHASYLILVYGNFIM